MPRTTDELCPACLGVVDMSVDAPLDYWWCEKCHRWYHYRCQQPLHGYVCLECLKPATAWYMAVGPHLPPVGDHPPFSVDVLVALACGDQLLAAYNHDAAEWVVPFCCGGEVDVDVVAWCHLPRHPLTGGEG